MTDFYHRNLPHWQPANALFFITFRLVNSLPLQVIQDLQEQHQREQQATHAKFNGEQRYDELDRVDKKYFGQFDTWLDRCVKESPRWLADEKIAQIVADEIHKLDGERYNLSAYCVLSNHCHLLVETSELPLRPEQVGVTAPYPLTDALKLLKGRTARYCNQALERSGAFWSAESYDHVVRDAKEYERIRNYIAQNPVKAGLVKNWEDWKFTYINP
jgi:putative transposase